MPKIDLGNFENGISQLGKMELGKWYVMDNLDIHGEPGLAVPNLAMESESTTPNEACYTAIDPTGTIWLVSRETGKIWKRTTAGAYSLQHTNVNTAQKGCAYFNGLLWYWTATKLGYYDLSSTWDDSFATFTNSNARGSVEANNTLLIGDGRDVARIDAANVFSSSEFTMPAIYNATDLVNIGDDVLIGTYVGATINDQTSYCKVFKWNTIDVSWTSEDEIFEIGVNYWLQLDDIYIAQCGIAGRFYYYDGVRMKRFGQMKTIQGNVLKPMVTTLGEQKSVNYKGRTLFANANKIYSLHREDSRFPYAFCGEYTCTGTIYSLIVQEDKLLASVGTGMDKKNEEGGTYAIATIETPEVQQSVGNCRIYYDEYPAGIGIQTKVQKASSYGSLKTPVINPIKRYVDYDGGEEDNVAWQAKITLTPDGINVPKLIKLVVE